MKHINVKKIIYIIIMTILILCNLFHYSSATEVINPNYDFLPPSEDPRITDAAGSVLGAVRLVGTILSVLIIAVIGVEYILSSPEGKADYKKNMIPFLIGAGLLFIGASIPHFIFEVIHQ